MRSEELKIYKRDALLGALGAILMLLGDLCLKRDFTRSRRPRAFYAGSLSKRFVGIVATAVTDCNGILRYDARIFYRARIVSANKAAISQDPSCCFCGRRNLIATAGTLLFLSAVLPIGQAHCRRCSDGKK